MFNKWFIFLALSALILNISCDRNPTVSKNTAPTASFTVSQTVGTTATIFNFDASGCTDNEDETSVLQVRWDWNNDGVWDTDYRTLKTIIHQFPLSGTYTIILEVKDTGSLTNTVTKIVTVSKANTAPTASFTVSPTSGTADTVFDFDASGSTDDKDETSVLQVRWDWNNDGTYDTDFTTTKTATHQYTSTGTYTVKLEVKDSEDLTNTSIKTVSVSNTAPTASFTIDPISGTTATIFTFDASGSTDEEDDTSVLQIRWDWNNDGTYDTDYTTTKTATHQYTSTSTYTVKLEVKDSGDLTHTMTKNVSLSNTAPTASFTISPTSGTVDTVFDFDASGSTDNEDATAVLQVRWDWNNDGTYDTDFTTTKTATHQYSNPGTFTVNLEVKDDEDLTNTTTMTVNVQQQSTVVTFSDPNFEALIRSILGLGKVANGDITNLDMETIITLDGGNWNISDISGIEYCTNLQSLDLRVNQIIDISALSGLMNIQILTLLNNQIADISALSNLINLQVLGLSDNQIIDIYPLIQNSGIDNGDIVYLNNNWLSVTSVNTYIPQLEARGVTVFYDGSNVVIFSDPNFEALIRLALSKPTGDITDADMETITTLNGDGWYISNISGIEYCTNLQSLDLRNNQIVDIYPLVQNSGIDNGDIIYLNNNWLSVTSVNTYIPQLEARGVTVYYDGVTVVTFSDANFEALIRSTLNKPTGGITDADMETIITLNGGGWNISNISGIEYCTNLQSLDLRNNQIINISALSGLMNIQILTLWDNQIADISALSNLINLQVLGLSDNHIIDIYPLIQNNGINNGDTVYLTNNWLSVPSVNNYIPELEGRGVTVYY